MSTRGYVALQRRKVAGGRLRHHASRSTPLRAASGRGSLFLQRRKVAGGAAAPRIKINPTPRGLG